MPIALLYHDVTEPGDDDASGFAGPGAARYKISPREFADHLAAVAVRVSAPPAVAEDVLNRRCTSGSWLLTVDDGGVSAISQIADLLDKLGWFAHFFVTTGYIDTPGFLTCQQICELAERGHIIGTHTCTHPARMSCCSWEQLVEEWQSSQEVLSDILGKRVVCGSVPGGYYSPAVARAAACAGLRVLFTSEPTARCWEVEGCLVLGRYTVYRGVSAEATASMAVGNWLPRFQQSIVWRVKKLAKWVGGTAYLGIRERLLREQYSPADRR